MSATADAPTRTVAGPSPAFAWSVLVTLYFVWGTTYLGIAKVNASIPPLVGAAARFLIAGTLLYGFRRFRTEVRPTARQWRSTGVVGVFLLFVVGSSQALAADEMPRVYDNENTGAAVRQPALPPFADLKPISHLPDPFLKSDGSRISTRDEWRVRRAEIKALLENYDVGEKPAKPSTFKATLNDNTITITVGEGPPRSDPSGDGPPVIVTRSRASLRPLASMTSNAAFWRISGGGGASPRPPALRASRSTWRRQQNGRPP